MNNFLNLTISYLSLDYFSVFLFKLSRYSPPMMMAFSWIHQYRRIILILLYWILLGLGFAFAIVSFQISGSCYVSSCTAASEFRPIWQINSGTEFESVVSAFFFILLPIYGLWFLRQQCDDLLVGTFFGGSILTTVLALVNAVYWGSFVSMLSSLPNQIHLVSSMTVSPNTSLIQSCRTLTAFSSLLFIFGIMSLVMFVFFRDVFFENASQDSALKSKIKSQAGYKYQGVHVEDHELEDM